MLSVKETYGGRGIGGKLTELTIEYMRTNNIPVISMLCSSHFTGLICKKMNFKREYALNYAEYFVDGKNPILPAEPHKAAQIFAKKIEWTNAMNWVFKLSSSTSNELGGFFSSLRRCRLQEQSTHSYEEW